LASLDQDVLLSRPDAHGTWAMNDGVLSRFQQRLYRHPAILPSAEGVWAEPAHAFVMNADMRLHASAGTGAGCLCADFPLQVRYRQGGERCRPAGRGHSQTLKHLMQEYAVPPWLRDAVPLLYAGDTLVAVGDYWVCAEYEAAENQTGWKIHWEIAVAN
jgi:tRNA(Ile)-lysidine synthase